MRICHVIEAAAGGSAGIVLSLAERGVAAGKEVTVIYSPVRASPQFFTGAGRLGGVRFIPLNMHREVVAHDLRAAAELRSILQHEQFNVVHSHSSKAGALARLAGIGGRSVQIYSPHGFVTMADGVAAIVATHDGRTQSPNLELRLPTTPEAQILYVQARDDLAQRSSATIGKAVTEFNQVVTLEPHFAPAFSGIESAYLLEREFGSLDDSVAFPEARSAVLHAQQLDPRLASAYSPAGVLFRISVKDVRNARTVAIVTSTGRPPAHHMPFVAGPGGYVRATPLAPSSQEIGRQLAQDLMASISSRI